MFSSFLSGAIVLAALIIALFFFRFQRQTHDRLFGLFAVAFILLGVERIYVEFMLDVLQSDVYLVRLLAFLLILFAIWDKNRKEKKG